MALTVGVPREAHTEERRVALTPAATATLKKKNIDVIIEQGAGNSAGYPDRAYEEKGAVVVGQRDEVFQKADVIAQVRGLGANGKLGEFDIHRFRQGQLFIAQMEPFASLNEIKALADKGALGFALELVPRITRAQNMDVLSSQASIAGYKAVILAAEILPRLFPMMTTAAGTLTAARVFIIGAGVAGLQAIATARRLGAVINAYDVRPAVKEQVQSLGAKFVELPLETAEGQGGYARAMDEAFYAKQRELMAKVCAASDVVITTAAIPGKKAPILITNEMVAGMTPGSVIVDIAAERGGNCELTRAGEIVEQHGVKVAGPLNLPSSVPFHASQTYANNIVNFLLNMVKDGALTVNAEDEIVRDTLLCRDGAVVNAKLLEALQAQQS